MSQLFGPVKTILELTWKVNGANIAGPEHHLGNELNYLYTEVYTYSRFGDLLYIVLWDKRDKIVRKADLTYNRKGELIHESLFYLGYGYEQKIYEYDTQGRRMEIKLYRKNHLKERTLYIYDKRGLCVRTDELNNEGELVISRHFDYNADENLVHMEKTNENGEKIGEEFKYFNEPTKLIKKNYCCTKGLALNPWEKIIACYDCQGNIISETWHRPNGEEGRHNIHEYEFDRCGNWISRKTFENGFLNCRKERNIEYF